jgi:membrane-bound lytic murein transglycosylase A
MLLLSTRSFIIDHFKLPTLFLSIFLAGCASNPGISSTVGWNKLKGWSNDNHQELLPPLLAQCVKLEKKSTTWQQICDHAKLLPTDNAQSVQVFFQQWFEPHAVNGINSKTGLITGYYEPLLLGSMTKTSRFNYPLYKKPNDLLKITAAENSNLLQVKDNRARGKRVDNKLTAYYSRAQIDGPAQPLAGQELLWVDDSDDAFFLHIQGSGLVQLTDGSVVSVGYADQNGHSYRAIGRDLVKMEEIAQEDISLQSIKQWLTDNPTKAQALKNKNPSYIFFTLRTQLETGPRGSLNVPLTAQRSVAVDRSIIPLGTPLWLSTNLPESKQPYQRLMFAQDTGGAINGPVRVDVFFGRGENAKSLAGSMKQEGQVFVLLPKK